MRLHAALLALVLLPSCADEYNTPLPLAPPYQATTINYNAIVTTPPATSTDPAMNASNCAGGRCVSGRTTTTRERLTPAKSPVRSRHEIATFLVSMLKNLD